MILLLLLRNNSPSRLCRSVRCSRVWSYFCLVKKNPPSPPSLARASLLSAAAFLSGASPAFFTLPVCVRCPLTARHHPVSLPFYRQPPSPPGHGLLGGRDQSVHLGVCVAAAQPEFARSVSYSGASPASPPDPPSSRARHSEDLPPAVLREYETINPRRRHRSVLRGRSSSC